jgi:hypothetical protein
MSITSRRPEAARDRAMTARPTTRDSHTRLAALLGAATGLGLALIFGADIGTALAQGWETVVLPAFHALNLSGFASCF